MVSLSQDVSPPTMTLLEALRETLDGGFADEDVEELVPRWTQAAPAGNLPRPEAVAWTEEVARPFLRDASSKRLAEVRLCIVAIKSVATTEEVVDGDYLHIQHPLSDNLRARQARLYDNLKQEITRGEILERRRAPGL